MPPLRSSHGPLLSSNDYTSLDEFPLGWRFTSQRLSRPAADVVSRLRPLGRDAAARAARTAGERDCDAIGEPRTFRSDDPPGTVRTNLHALAIDPRTEIVLSWNPSTALRTDWETFVGHWDDFCYPAADNVDIRAPDGDWILRYHHYEVFQFWRVLVDGVDGSIGPRADA